MMSLLEMTRFNGKALKDMAIFKFDDMSVLTEEQIDTVWNIRTVAMSKMWDGNQSVRTAELMANGTTGILFSPSQSAGPDGFLRLSDEIIVLVGVKYRSGSIKSAIVANDKTTKPELLFTMANEEEYKDSFGCVRDKVRNMSYKVCIRLHIILGQMPRDKTLVRPRLERVGEKIHLCVYVYAENLGKFFSPEMVGFLERLCRRRCNARGLFFFEKTM